MMEQFFFHEVHVGGYMGEELAEIFAEVVKSANEPVLGTAPVADEEPLARLALVG